MFPGIWTTSLSLIVFLPDIQLLWLEPCDPDQFQNVTNVWPSTTYYSDDICVCTLVLLSPQTVTALENQFNDIPSLHEKISPDYCSKFFTFILWPFILKRVSILESELDKPSDCSVLLGGIVTAVEPVLQYKHSFTHWAYVGKDWC